MAVLVSNATPFIIWRIGGGLVGACRSLDEARGLMADLKRTFPDREYICKDSENSVLASSEDA